MENMTKKARTENFVFRRYNDKGRHSTLCWPSSAEALRGYRNPNPEYMGTRCKSAHQISSHPNQSRPRIFDFFAEKLRVNRLVIVTYSSSTSLHWSLSLLGTRVLHCSELSTIRSGPCFIYDHCSEVSIFEGLWVGAVEVGAVDV